jgi:hypothetical protein
VLLPVVVLVDLMWEHEWFEWGLAHIFPLLILT